MKIQAPTTATPCPFRIGCGKSQEDHNVNTVPSHSRGCMSLAGDTPVPTPDGWTTLNEITVGQEVFDQAGRQHRVLAVCHRQPEEVFLVMFDDESHLLAGARQPWVTLSHNLRHKTHRGTFHLPDWAANFAPATTDQVRDSLIHRRGTLVEAMHSIPLAKPLVLPDRDLPIDPYLLGLWLGDGTSSSPVITCHEDDEPYYREKSLVAGERWRTTRGRNHVLSCSMARGPHPLLRNRLRQLEVLNNKHTPLLYLRSSMGQRLELLRGLMDSDGCIHHGTGQAEYTSISEKLSKGVLELTLTLGQKATLRKGDAKLAGMRTSDKWRVTFTPTISVFSLPRKAEVLNEFLERRVRGILPRLGQRYLRSVEPASAEPTVCMVVDSPTRMFLAGEHMIPVRSSGLMGVNRDQ